MPGRVARSNLPSTAPKSARSKNKKRSFDAYAAASKATPEKSIAKHRLGEDIEDEPRPKRARSELDDEDDREESQRRRLAKRGAAGDDEILEYGSDSSGNEWTLGGLGEDDEDSDLDSDEAFGESDEERFEGFSFRGSSSTGKTKKRSRTTPGLSQPGKEIDLNEADRETEDEGDSDDDVGVGLGEDAVDLATMLDDEDEDITGGKDSTLRDLGEESASDEDDYDEEETDESSSEGDDFGGDVDEEQVARMRDRLDALDSATDGKKATESRADEVATIDDFLAGTEFANDKQLSSASRSKKKSAKMTPLAAPLPKRQQDRIDREVASQKAKEQLDRWRDTVVRNRRAEFLTFPLQDPNDQTGTTGRDKFEPASQQKPQTDLEANIQRIMEESGLAPKPGQNTAADLRDEETALLKSEELATNKMPVEEVLRRRAELRRARELLFREEIKAKRIAKIKSKSYRRVHRKERERLAENEREARMELGEDSMEEDEKERNDRRRASARMSTKHKDSKWAKSLKASSRATWDDDARDGVIEQARRNEELRRRMAGDDISDDEDDSDSLDDADDDNDDNDRLTALNKLTTGLGPGQQEGNGVANMKFMRDAEERKRKANDEDIERLRKELAIADGDEDDEEGEKLDNEEGLGRAIFGPGSKDAPKPEVKKHTLEFEAPDSSDEEDMSHEHSESAQGESTQPNKAPSKANRSKFTRVSGPLAMEPSSENGFDSTGKKTSKSSRSRNGEVKHTSDWLQQRPRSLSKKNRGIADDDVLINLDTRANAGAIPKDRNHAPARNTSAGNTDDWTSFNPPETASDSDEDVSRSNPVHQQTSQSLIQRAFAGEDVRASFAAEKRVAETSEDEKEVSTLLPGWGSWTGAGLSKREKQANQRAKHNPLYKTKLPGGVSKADRKDAGREDVIISEKQDRKGKKYLATQLPHGFETKDQYERSRRVPMGPEWNTKEVYQRNTRPRVVIKKGVVGGAIERPIV